MRKFWKLIVAAGIEVTFMAGGAHSSSDLLKSGFENPPSTARPRVWWHWMDGNVTQDGIKLDLEWMHRVGLAGFQIFDVSLGIPQVVKQQLVYMTPAWKAAFNYAIGLGGQLGMEMAIASSPGWSESGAPWVPPSEAMKKYVWSETRIEGGKPFNGMLAKPPSNTGSFQSKGIESEFDSGQGIKMPEFYADATVIAFKRPAVEKSKDALRPTITSSGGPFDPAVLSDGNLDKLTGIAIPKKAGDVAWIQYELPKPQKIRAITFVTKDPNTGEADATGIAAPEKTLEASDDGQRWREVATLTGSNAPEHTVSFPAVMAKYFRITFKPAPLRPLPGWAVGVDPTSLGLSTTKPTVYQISELMLHTEPRVNHWEEKAAFVPSADLDDYPTPHVGGTEAIAKSDVIDLSSKMTPDGTLHWTPPPGDWIVLRFGYSLLGITNGCAMPEATGLEVDKLDHWYVKNYFEKYLDNYQDVIGKKGIRYMVNDSWEAGSQNWTDHMLAQFKMLRGYDPLPWMPVLAGRVVESAEASDRFLWDFRKTISDLIANEHYGELSKVLHERGMGHYGESHESERKMPADGMEVKKFNEIPMGAMWTQSLGVDRIQFNYNTDDRESASVAHLYGENIAAAESLTAAASPWAWSPETLKPTVDQAFLNGINRIVIHESTHQPLVGPNTAPGMTLGPFGQWFNRNETWAEQAGPWVKYIARTSDLLQQGHFVADVVYFYGEDSNLTEIYFDKSPDIPAGYGFDYINADALIHELKVSDGMLATKSGMPYKLLGLAPHSRYMSLPVLKAIHQLVLGGATVAGPKPTDDPSLADDQAEFQSLVDEMFGDGSGVHAVGKGKVYAGQDLANVLKTMNVVPDFDYSKSSSNINLQYVHRKLADGDLYFVDNRGNEAQTVKASFRVTGKAPELWYAETGTSKPVSFKISEGRTTLQLQLEPWGTVFVVFRKPTSEMTQTLPQVNEVNVGSVEGPWTISFQPDRGAPASITLDKLEAWNENSEVGVKYFSGVGTYTKTIQAPSKWFRNGSRMYLDLGSVKNLAEVMVNDKSLGIIWHAPFRLEVTDALKPGPNQVQIKVVNAWVNRLIGDEQPGATRHAMSYVKPYKANSSLLPSGLLGPVVVIREDMK